MTYRLLIMYSDEHMSLLSQVGYTNPAEWWLYNTYATRAGARGQATWFINDSRQNNKNGRKMYKSVRLEQFDGDNWNTLEEREIWSNDG